MSETKTQTRQSAVPMGSRTMAAMGQAPQKAKNFRLTFKRLLTWFRPFRVHLFIVLVMAIVSTVFTIVSPKLMGNAIDLVTTTLLLRLQGQDAAFDHPAINQVLLMLLGFYLMSSLFMFFTQWIMAGVSQRTVQFMRDATAAKLRRRERQIIKRPARQSAQTGFDQS